MRWLNRSRAETAAASCTRSWLLRMPIPARPVATARHATTPIRRSQWQPHCGTSGRRRECRIRLARVSIQAEEWVEAREAASRALTVSVRLGARHLESMARYWLAEALLGEFERAVSSAAPQPPDTSDAAEVLDATMPTADGAANETLRRRAEEEALTALRIAEDIGLAEVRWRATGLLASLAAYDAAGAEREERLLREAVSLLEALRSALTEAGIPDTLLENEDCTAIYVRLARLLHARGRLLETEDLLEQIGWASPYHAAKRGNGRWTDP